MRLIRFEEADSGVRTQIGEGLTRIARATGRLETGRMGSESGRHGSETERHGSETERHGSETERHGSGTKGQAPAVASGEADADATTRGGKYFLRHDDGCADCGAGVVAGDAFYLDPETGDVFCERHGSERRGDAE